MRLMEFAKLFPDEESCMKSILALKGKKRFSLSDDHNEDSIVCRFLRFNGKSAPSIAKPFGNVP